MRAALLASALFAAAAAAGCGACEPDRTSPAPSASSAASVVPPPLTPPQRPHNTAMAPKAPCKIITLDGEAHTERPGAPADASTAALLLQGLAPIDAWFDVAKGGRLVARDPRTARETTFRGPARARACVAYGEESWLASGRYESTLGSGEAPGEEEWIVTPFGVVRYTAARLSVDVGARDADVVLETGQAFAWGTGTDAGDEEGWTRLPAGKMKLVERGDATAAIDTCSSLATNARALAAQVLAPEGGADAGTIARQVMTRRLARAACAVASLRANALSPQDAGPLLRRLSEANAAWSALP